MPNQLNSGELIANISSELADNNAGLISAYDVRHNMEDIAVSINKIIASGDTHIEYPFYSVVRISNQEATDPTSTVAHSGDAIIESGIFFPNSAVNPTKRQTQPWLGESYIDHNALDNLTVGNPHTQYYLITGDTLEGNMGTDTFWVNKSGVDDVGFKFEQLTPDAKVQEIYVSGTMRWGDNSTMPNGKGQAKAWVNFDASGVGDFENLPMIRSYHNISGIKRDAPGKFTITLSSGVFQDNNYVAIGTANARTDSDDPTDFEINTVGITVREGDEDTLPRTCKVSVVNLAGEYVDSQLIDIAFYGYEPMEASGLQTPTVSRDALYTDS
jgi:hypothetical protein